MKRIKPVVLTLCAVLVVAATIFGTVAYLTDTSEITNTFTVGKVKLTLDEAVVGTDGVATGGRTDEGNAYHLIPGQNYIKDPTVTVSADSEEAYVRMMLTLTCASELDAIFTSVMTELFEGYDDTVWVYETETPDTANNTVTYEFRYANTVDPQGTAQVLDPLFDKLTVPAALTGAQLETISNLKITVQAHAIQATGFADADEAWNAFSI